MPARLPRRPLPRPVAEGLVLTAAAALVLLSWSVTDAVPVVALLALGGVPLAALWWRRDAPLAVFLVVLGLSVLSRLLYGSDGPSEVPLVIAVYTVASRRPPWWAAGALAADLGVLALMLSVGGVVEDTGLELLSQLIAGTIAVLLGMYVQSRRVAERALRDRADRLEREQLIEAQAAVEEERRRIARELHDVVAHHVSVMTMQAGGLEAQLRRASVTAADPDATLTAAAAAIRQTGQEAMTELRRLLHVLHHADDDDARSPQPDLSALDLLADRVRTAGLPLTVDVDGDADTVTAGMALAIYRIVQEALTNTLRHAGTVPTTVHVRIEPAAVDVRVRDVGAEPRTVPRFPTDDGGGHGLLGMRERAALFGGTVVAAPHPDGGFEVRAHLPRDPRGAPPT